MRQKKSFESKETHLFQYNDPILNIALDNEWLYEIFVPTCSYRMGTSKIGYGAAVVGELMIFMLFSFSILLVSKKMQLLWRSITYC